MKKEIKYTIYLIINQLHNTFYYKLHRKEFARKDYLHYKTHLEFYVLLLMDVMIHVLVILNEYLNIYASKHILHSSTLFQNYNSINLLGPNQPYNSRNKIIRLIPRIDIHFLKTMFSYI